MEEEYCENTTAIEVTFPVAVNLSDDQQRRLVEVIGGICKEYERNHPDRVMWAAGIGGRMLTNPFMVDDEHPMEFDMAVFSVECCERERFEGERQ